jgi:hypothetical protein
MKNLLKITIVMLLLGSVFAGCKKDDEDNPKNNGNMKYDGVEYDLANGYLENYGKFDDDEAYNLDLVFLSSGLTVFEENGELDSIAGNGHAIIFELFSNSNTMLTAGTYEYDVDETGAAFTFDYSSAVLNYVSETDEGTDVYVNGGTAIVTNAGSEYEINFNLTTLGNKNIVGYFKGGLHYYNYEDQEKTKSTKSINRYFNLELFKF